MLKDQLKTKFSNDTNQYNGSWKIKWNQEPGRYKDRSEWIKVIDNCIKIPAL